MGQRTNAVEEVLRRAVELSQVLLLRQCSLGSQSQRLELAILVPDRAWIQVSTRTSPAASQASELSDCQLLVR